MEIIPYMGMNNRKFRKRIHNGLLLFTDPSEHIQQQLFWYGFYEKKYVLTWESMMKPDWIVLDIGANIGYYSLVASKKSSHGKVFAFEPDTRNLSMLRENILLNHIQNIEIIPAAVSDENTISLFYKATRDNMGMSGLTRPENTEGPAEQVKCVTIDHWVEENNIKKVSCIKLDIEGAEYKALAGMMHTLEQCSPVLFIEVYGELLQRHGNKPTEIYDLLSSLNYTAYRITEDKTLQNVDGLYEDELVVFMKRT